jgi:hypothetical protein
VAFGQLVLAIQKEEDLVAGDSKLWAPALSARENADALYHAATTPATLRAALGGKSLTEYIGAAWLSQHHSVRPTLEAVLKSVRDANV